MGVCASYTTAWKYLKALTTEARYLETIRSGHWIWAYDNLNLKQHIRHEREGKSVHVIEHYTQLITLLFDNRLSLIHDECDVTVGHQDQVHPRL